MCKSHDFFCLIESNVPLDKNRLSVTPPFDYQMGWGGEIKSGKYLQHGLSGMVSGITFDHRVYGLLKVIRNTWN